MDIEVANDRIKKLTKVFGKINQKDPLFSTYGKLALINIQISAFQLITILPEIEEYTPQRAKLISIITTASCMMGNNDEAAEIWEHLMKEHSDNPYFKYYHAYFKRGSDIERDAHQPPYPSVEPI